MYQAFLGFSVSIISSRACCKYLVPGLGWWHRKSSQVLIHSYVVLTALQSQGEGMLDKSRGHVICL